MEAIDGPFQVDPDSNIGGIEGPDAALEVHPKEGEKGNSGRENITVSLKREVPTV